MAAKHIPQDMPVIARVEDFDEHSGVWLERFVFNHRLWVLGFCLLLTLFLGWHALRLPVNASFDGMIPQSHSYIKNYFAHRDSLRGMGNSVRIAVENKKGSIFDTEYLLQLQKLNDAIYLLPGVDRGYMRGLWTSSLRWTEITEEGFRGGPVMPRWKDNPNVMEDLRINISRGGIVGSFVSNDMKSSLIQVPLVELNPETGKPLDYANFGRSLEAVIQGAQTKDIHIHVVGFAQLVHDLIKGLYRVMQFFAISALIAAILVFLYTRCIRSTLLLVFSAILGVIWLLGLMQLFGYVLNPYSILVPFLIFAVGLSHGAQKMNGIMQDVGRGTHKYVAARYTFRRLFMAGLTALLANVVGFAVLAIIDIPVIREMAITTSIGVTVLIFTKLMLIPVLLSYIGVSPKAAKRSLHIDEHNLSFAARRALSALTQPRQAKLAVAVAAALTVFAVVVAQHVKFGDLDFGAPELRPDSRYNRDNAYITANYGLSSDQFVVMMTPSDCRDYAFDVEADRLSTLLRETEGVQTTLSLAEGIRQYTMGGFEGNPKWYSIQRNEGSRSAAFNQFGVYRPDLVGWSCVVTPLIVYLEDHKADTLTRMVKTVEQFAAEHETKDNKFLLAAGSAGIEATTNIVVRKSFWTMHFVLYGAVILLCFITFRNWRAVLVALIPLGITSILCEALMVWLGIGIKVATLPVIAVGVGIGVDYALYLLSIQLALQRRGETLREAYLGSLDFTGRIVALVGITMAVSVVTWAWSPIKFQADMGILLTFMFIWNLIGALVLIPALSYFLLRTDADKNPKAEEELKPTLDVFSIEG